MRHSYWLILLFLLLSLTTLTGLYAGYADFMIGSYGNPLIPMSLDQEEHIVNDVYFVVTNRGMVAFDDTPGRYGAYYPIGLENNYVYGSGLWIGGLADVDGNQTTDIVFTQGFNPLGDDNEFLEGRVGQLPSDPLARVFDSLDPLDYLEWPPEFKHYDPQVGDTVPLIYSTQDLVTIYNSLETPPVFGVGNLPLEVQQRTMAFNGEGINQVIYAIFDITNSSEDTPLGPYVIEDAWIGFDSDMDIGQAFSDDMTSVLLNQITGSDTIDLDLGIAWDSDFNERVFTGWPGFVGVTLLQSPGNPHDGIDNDGDGTIDESPWNGIDDDGDGEIDEQDEVDEIGLVNYSKHCNPAYPSTRCELQDPETDIEGYDLLSCDTKGSDITCLESTTSADIRFMISSGPFDWLPGETYRLVIAFIFSESVGDPMELELTGDPPRPDPNDPALSRLIEVTVAARDFWFSGLKNYQIPLNIFGTTQLEDTNDISGPYEVFTNVVDSVGISRVSLFHSTDGFYYEETLMIYQHSTEYMASLPGYPLGITIQYYIQAVDSSFSVVRDPENAPLSTYDFEIIDAPNFRDVTEQFGLPTYNYIEAVWFDYDLDDDDDLYLASLDHDSLYRNDGDTLFTNVTLEAGIVEENDFGVGVQTADYDNDGDFDLYVSNSVTENFLFRNRGDGTFEEVAEEAGIDVQLATTGAVWGDYDEDGYLDLLIIGSRVYTPILFRNKGDGTFEDRTVQAGLDTMSQQGITIKAAMFFDQDRDGDPDIYLVQNSTSGGVENIFYDNNGDNTFTDRTEESGLSDEGDGRDFSLVDFDKDGDLDLFLLNSGPNRLFRNDSGGTYTDMAEEAGIRDLNAYACSFADVNIDGYPDLLLSSPKLYINNGNGSFTDRTSFAGIQEGGRIVIPTNIGDDGFPDIYNYFLYQNEGYPVDIGRSWLRVELQGVRSPRDGTGSLVEVVTEGMRQVKVCGEGTGKSMGSIPVEFGLGEVKSVDNLIIYWTSGVYQELGAVAVNQVIRVEEDTTLVGIGKDDMKSPSLPTVFALFQNYPNPFNPSTTIRYDIPAGTETLLVKVFVYDVRGHLVRKLVDQEKEPGRYQVHWDGRDNQGQSVSSGVYLYRIEVSNFVSTRKMVVVR